MAANPLQQLCVHKLGGGGEAGGWWGGGCAPVSKDERVKWKCQKAKKKYRLWPARKQQLLLLLKIKEEKLSANTGRVTLRTIIIDFGDFLKFLNSSINWLSFSAFFNIIFNHRFSYIAFLNVHKSTNVLSLLLILLLLLDHYFTRKTSWVVSTNKTACISLTLTKRLGAVEWYFRTVTGVIECCRGWHADSLENR